MLGSAIAVRARMGPWMLPALIVVAVLVVAFLAWEIFFVKSGENAVIEQHHEEGHSKPPKVV